MNKSAAIFQIQVQATQRWNLKVGNQPVFCLSDYRHNHTRKQIITIFHVF